MSRLEELAAPWNIWTKAGFNVTIASVKGGKIPLDPTSMQPQNVAGHGEEFLNNSTLLLWCIHLKKDFLWFASKADCPHPMNNPMPCAETAMEKLENSVPIAGLKADDFDAIYIPGGHGIAVDGPFDLTLRSLISDFAAQGKLVSAVCHGPIAFSGPELDGKPIVAGKKVTQSFTCANWQELCPSTISCRWSVLYCLWSQAFVSQITTPGVLAQQEGSAVLR